MPYPRMKSIQVLNPVAAVEEERSNNNNGTDISNEPLEPTYKEISFQNGRPWMNCGRYSHSSDLYNEKFIIIRGGIVPSNNKFCSDIEIFDIERQVMLDTNLTNRFLAYDFTKTDTESEHSKTKDNDNLHKHIRKIRKDGVSFTIDIDPASVRSVYSGEVIDRGNSSEDFATRCDVEWVIKSSKGERVGF